MASHKIVVVGASAGGVEALVRLIQGLPADFPAAVFVVLHIPAQAPSRLPDILRRAGRLPVAHAIDGMAIQPGHVYIAPPDHHLLIERGRVRVTRGPRENLSRPAVDPLFRTAAQAYGSRVIGVILSGTLDDGAAGLRVVKSRGGLAVVQDPSDALYDGMPRSALQYVDVDYCLPVANIPALLTGLVTEPTPEGAPMPDELETDKDPDRAETEVLDSDNRPGKPSVYTCPDCHGTLWEMSDGSLLHYRCRVGHAYTVDSLVAAQAVDLEESLWVALRALEEHISLNRRLELRSREQNMLAAAERFRERADEAEEHARRIREMLLNRHTTRQSEDAA